MIVFALPILCEEPLATLRRLADASCEALQVVPCTLIPSLKFALLAAAQAYESHKRGLLLARKKEIDLLMRLLRAKQIADALTTMENVKPKDGCCIAAGYGAQKCYQKIVAESEGLKPRKLEFQRTQSACGLETAVPLLGNDAETYLALEEAALLNARAKPSLS